MNQAEHLDLLSNLETTSELTSGLRCMALGGTAKSNLNRKPLQATHVVQGAESTTR